MEIIAVVQAIAILLSPLIAVLITQRLADRKRKLERKEETLTKLIEWRWNTSSDEFLRAINSIPVVFKDHPKIRTAYKELYDAIEIGKKVGDETIGKKLFVPLVLQICRELGYTKDIEESDIEKIFLKKI